MKSGWLRMVLANKAPHVAQLLSRETRNSCALQKFTLLSCVGLQFGLIMETRNDVPIQNVLLVSGQMAFQLSSVEPSSHYATVFVPERLIQVDLPHLYCATSLGDQVPV